MKYKVIVSIPTGPKSSLHQGLTIDAEHPPVIGDRVTLEGDVRPWTILAVINIEAARNLESAEKKLAEHGIGWENGKGYVFNPPAHAENCVCFQCLHAAESFQKVKQ
jgi:hypothetical protein